MTQRLLHNVDVDDVVDFVVFSWQRRHDDIALSSMSLSRRHVIMTMRMSFWRRRRLGIVVATSLQHIPQPSSVIVVDDDRRHGRRPSLDIRHCRLSLSVVIVEIRRLVWGHAITMSMFCVCLGPLSVRASGYGYSSMTSVPAILLRLTGVSVPVSCPLLPVPRSGNGNNVITVLNKNTIFLR